MTAKAQARLFRRWMFSGVTWAMIPLAIASGMPVTSCGCGNCHCGTALAGDHSSAASMCQADQSDGQRSGCCSAHGQNAAQHSRCCCGSRMTNSQSSGRPIGNGISNVPSRCNTLVSVRHAVQPTVTVPDNHLMPAVIVLPIDSAGSSPQAVGEPQELKTGPPTDLIVTLRHLLI